MAFIATYIDGPTDWGGQPEKIERTTSGSTGQRHYKINTRVVEEMLGAEGLPKIGDPWSPSLPGLKVVTQDFGVIGGVPDQVNDTRGWGYCNVRYSTDGLAGSTPPVFPGYAYTLFRPAVSAVTALFDARRALEGASPPFEFVQGRATDLANPAMRAPMNNGRGVQVPVGSTQIIVVKYYSNVDAIDMARLLRLQRRQYVNLENVSTPPVQGGTQGFTFDKGELRFTSFDMDFDRGLTALAIYLEGAPDHLFDWSPEDQDGNSIDNVGPYANVLFPAEDFSGLW